jgi:hypothetical protein
LGNLFSGEIIMSVQVANDTDVIINTMTKTSNFVVNSVFLTLFRIANGRDLSPTYLSERRQVIEEGIFTWISEQTLETLILEVYLMGTDQGLERYEFKFHYVADPDMEVRHTPIKQIETFLSTLKQLPSEATYQVLVTLKTGATQIPGWPPSKFKQINIKREENLGNFGFGHAGVEIRFLGSQE